jgi:methylglyoxal synthase
MEVIQPARTIAMTAHDLEKARLVDFAVGYRDVLARHRLVATATTGRMLAEMVGLEVDCLDPRMAGGESQIVDAIAGPRVAAVIFLVDPRCCRRGEPGPKPVIEACSRHDVPLAMNLAAAGAILRGLTP